jgi:outer membrane protein OmpA-like peptidoglycan-associated protein
MLSVPHKSKSLVPHLLVRLSVVFALVGSMMTFAIAPASASGNGNGYYNCNTGDWDSDPADPSDLMTSQGATPSGTYLIWDMQLWSGFSCTGDVEVSTEAVAIQAPAFNGNIQITSIFIPENTRVVQVDNDQFAALRAFAGTDLLTTIYYCGEWSLANTGIEGKTWITCPSAPTIKQTFNVGHTYIEFRPSTFVGGSSTMTYSVTAHPLGGVAFEPTLSNFYSGSDGADYFQYQIDGLLPDTAYTFSVSANNGYFDSSDSSRSVQVNTPPGDGWYLCEDGAYNPDQGGHQLSYRIVLGIVVENSNCEDAVTIRPGTFGIEEGFIDSSITSVSIPESVRFLYKAFQDSAQLSQVTFLGNSRLADIGQSSFEGTNLNTITIPSAVEEIGEYAFRDTTQLVQMNFASNSQLDYIDYGAFKNTRLSTITIPSMVNTIDRNAFLDTPYLSSIEVDAANETFRSVNGVLFRLDEDELYDLYKYPQAKLGSSYTIPENVQRIGARAFANTDLSFVNIPSTLNFIGYEAFKESEVTFPNLYRNWQTPMSATTNSPKTGETLWASAFERVLPRTLFKEDVAQDPEDPSDDYRTNTADYPTPEEYVYRITKEPNAPATSVDHQSNEGYESLTDAEQSQWYVDAGLGGENYEFSWNAFMCVSYPSNVLTVTKPTGLKYSYASREDGILLDGSLNVAHNFMFKEAATDWIDAEFGSWQTPRSAVGTKHNNNPYTQAFIGDSDGIYYSFVWGMVDVSASCGSGQTLEALRIVVDQNTPITTKNFVIPETLNLSHVGNVATDVPSAGITIGVTGGSGAPEYNAALWGLTTIADSNITPPPTQAPTQAPTTPPTTTPTSAPSINSSAAAVAKPASNLGKAIRFSTSSKVLTQAHKNALKKSFKASGKDATYVVTGNAGFLPGVTEAQVKKLARVRANIVRDYLVKLGVNRANITIKITTTNRGIVPKTKALARFMIQ